MNTTDTPAPPSAAAAGSEDHPAQILKEFERLIERASGQVALLIRHGDRIIIRDNSGITGLTGEVLMQKCLALLDELFPQNAVFSGGEKGLSK